MVAKTLADGSVEVKYDSMHINHAVEMNHSQLNDDDKAFILSNFILTFLNYDLSAFNYLHIYIIYLNNKLFFSSIRS